MSFSSAAMRLICCALILLLLVDLSAREVGAQPATEKSRPLTFERDVAPILKAHCYKCHGGKQKKAGLDLRRRFSMVAGGDSGPSIVPGKPQDSLLIEMLAEKLMPPEGEAALAGGQADVLRRWIAAGAPIAGDKELPLELAEVKDDVSDEDRQFWAFQPPRRPKLPRVAAIDRLRNPIDAFLLDGLEREGLTFNADANKRVLVRRLYFDLHGLPPTPQQVAAFLADNRPDAYERLVDRLLASPRFGERWGRHWLDVAGYADSDGYLAADRVRPEAWRYRDYVIRAINADKPYDRFVLEQLAGDELTDWRRADELSSDMIEKLVATGFLRTASDPTYGNYKEPLECHKVMSDTVEIISSAFLGLTVQCARCHSHKMEPISQRDYYRLNANLLASYDPQRWLVSAARSIPLATESQLAAINQNNQAVDQRVAVLNKQLGELTTKFRQKQLAVVPQEVRGEVEKALLADPKKRTEKQNKLIAEHASGLNIDEKTLAERFSQFKDEAAKLRAAVAAESALKKDVVQLRGIVDLDDRPAPAHILVRGDYNNPGANVEPGVPAVLSPSDFRFQPKSGYKTTGRRRAFAEWLVDANHPLTSRVQVNRIWSHHFGRGLVPTLANFGRSGSRPSHPKLLDWLATELIARGWRQKALHRLILTSTAYRQSSATSTSKQTADPENVLLSRWQPQRHDGEVVRDGMLFLAGKLNLAMHGRPVDVSRRPDNEVVPADNADGNRRSIYLIVRRSQPLTLLNLFDTPRMEVNCPQRARSTVVTQALTLMNSEFTAKIATALADRIHSRGERDRNANIGLRIRTSVQPQSYNGRAPSDICFSRPGRRDTVRKQKCRDWQERRLDGLTPGVGSYCAGVAQ